MARQSIDFEDTGDGGGFTRRSVHLDDDGSLIIEGHDLGDAVEELFGHREYEFERRIDAAGVARLRSALDIAEDAPLLDALRERFARTDEIERAAAEAGIDSRFWSRIGD